MKPLKTNILRFGVLTIGLFVYAIAAFVLPPLAKNTAIANPEYAYLRWPVLLGIYATLLPFTMVLIQSMGLLNLIEKNKAFSKGALKALKIIKQSTISVTVAYVIGGLFLKTANALHPGLALGIVAVCFTTVMIAFFSDLLHTLLDHALSLKEENDLTI